jgi:hypothetical protein
VHRAELTEGDMLTQNPIDLRINPDKSYTMYYFSEEVGYIERLMRRNKTVKMSIWRVCTVNGALDYCGSLKTAKSRLLEMHH